MAVVGLEQTFFWVSEEEGLVELCVNVSFPDTECPIKFTFNLNIATRDGSAGWIYLPHYIQITFYSAM